MRVAGGGVGGNAGINLTVDMYIIEVGWTKRPIIDLFFGENQYLRESAFRPTRAGKSHRISTALIPGWGCHVGQTAGTG